MGYQCRLDRPDQDSPTRLQNHHCPRFANIPGNRANPVHRIKFLNPSSNTWKTVRNPKMAQRPIKNNTNSFNHIYVQNDFIIGPDERSKILTWLSPLGPQKRHRDIRTRRIDEVGDWLLQTEEYRNWFGDICEGKPGGSALFCYGGPGVGKTYIR